MTHPIEHRYIAPLNELARDIYQSNVDAGWWTDLETGGPKERNTGELLMLVVSEIAEAMEGHRKGLMDTHLPHWKMMDVELADVIIRIMDICGHYRIPIGEILMEKWEYNRSRADHKIENRSKAGGKAY